MDSNSNSSAVQNKLLVRDRFDAWSEGRGSPFELLAEDVVWTIEGNSVASRTYAGRDAFMRTVIQPFNARMSVGLKPFVRQIIAEGDDVLIFFDGKATARDGKPYQNTYFWLFEMHGGKVTRAYALFDSVEFNDFWNRVSPTTI